MSSSFVIDGDTSRRCAVLLSLRSAALRANSSRTSDESLLPQTTAQAEIEEISMKENNGVMIFLFFSYSFFSINFTVDNDVG